MVSTYLLMALRRGVRSSGNGSLGWRWRSCSKSADLEAPASSVRATKLGLVGVAPVGIIGPATAMAKLLVAGASDLGVDDTGLGRLLSSKLLNGDDD